VGSSKMKWTPFSEHLHHATTVALGDVLRELGQP